MARTQEPVAIVGIGCRFPGGSDDPTQFWNLISNGEDAISVIPKDRWNAMKFYDPDPAIPDRTQALWGGLVDNAKIEAFDPSFFGISAREADYVDPQQRLLLETAWEALQDGGLALDPRQSTNMGVFVGISTNDYSSAQYDWIEGSSIDMYSPTGGAMSIAANRVSFCFNLQGPSMAVDTACSSSLVSVHLACQAIWNNECESALAAGVNVILNPDTYKGFCRMSMLSPDGRCKPFDAKANGFTRGEGAGVLLLKPLSKAQADKDRIYALIRGTAVNQDGTASPGLTMPAQSSQERVIQAACHSAGIDPGAIHFVEAHGTGTAIGDPIEARALGKTIGLSRQGPTAGEPQGRPLYIGSVKSNIGHLESGAGIAGIIKVALSLYHRTIAPSLHFETPNPEIDFAHLNIEVASKKIPLPRNGEPVFAGVNSFGFGGTNAHIVLEAMDCALGDPGSDAIDSVSIMPLTAHDKGGLQRMALALKASLGEGGSHAHTPIGDICHTLALRRFHHPQYRGAVVAKHRAEVLDCLSALSVGDPHPGWCEVETVAEPTDYEERSNRVPCDIKQGTVADRTLFNGIVFVFCGQGPQWHAMGRDLMDKDPVFRQKMEQCDSLLRQCGGKWSLIEELSRQEADSRIENTAISQPAIFAVQVALAARWQAWGVEPAAVVGHSVGEVAAAHVAGVLSLEEAVRVIYHRGRCMAQARSGAMLAAGLSRSDALDLIAFSSRSGSVCLAATNSPYSVTLSGEASALAEIGKELDKKGIFQKALRVQYAFHSAQMDPIEKELVTVLEGGKTSPSRPLSPAEAKLPLYSTVTGGLTDGTEFTAAYWWQNVRQPVKFCDAIEALIAQGYRTFLELGPHPALTSSILETLRASGSKGHVFASLRRKEDEWASLLRAAGGLFASGCDLNWEAFCPGQMVTLPTCPWAREHHWSESSVSRNYRLGDRPHPLLGEKDKGAEPSWQCKVGQRIRKVLDDHRVRNRPLFPAAAYVEMAISAAKEIFGDDPCDLIGVEFFKAFFLPSLEEDCRTRFVFDGATKAFRIYSEASQTNEWVRHCQGEIHEVPESRQKPLGSYEFFDAEGLPTLPNSQPTEIETCYELFEKRGLQYAFHFRVIRKLLRRNGEALGLIRLSEESLLNEDTMRLHPALLDGCFQVMIAAVPDFDCQAGESTTVFLPTRIERIRFFESPQREVWSHVHLNLIGESLIEGSIRLFDGAGRILVEIEGFTCRAAGTVDSNTSRDWVYGIDFESVPLVGSEVVVPGATELPSIEELTEAIKERRALDAQREPWGRIYREKKQEINRTCLGYVRKALHDLGWQPSVGESFTPRELAEKLGVIERHHKVFERYLWILADDRHFAIGKNPDKLWQVTRWEPVEDPDILWRQAVKNFPAYHLEYTFARRFGLNLAEALLGRCEPVQLLFAHEGRLAEEMYTRSWSMRRGNTMACELVETALANRIKGRQIRILEIGGGTGGLTDWVLRSLPTDSISYVFTDITALFLNKAEERFRDFPFVSFQVLDIEKSPLEQGLSAHSFDLILASNVIHATSDLRQTLRHIREVLAPGGILAMIELTDPPRCIDLIFNMMDGWWAMTDERAKTLTPLLMPDQWQRILAESGFESPTPIEAEDGCQALILARQPKFLAVVNQPVRTPEDQKKEVTSPGVWLLFADQTGLADALAVKLKDLGHRTVLFRRGSESGNLNEDEVIFGPDQLETIESEMAKRDRFSGIIHCWSLDLEEPDRGDLAAITDIEKNLLSVVQIVRSFADPKKLTAMWLITRGAQPEKEGLAISISQAPLISLSRTIINENPAMVCRSVDLDPKVEMADDVCHILAELGASDEETEIARRGLARQAPRMVRRLITPVTREIRPSSESPYGLTIRRPGVLDSMVLVPQPRMAPGPGEVEIEVMSGALNFRDVMKALGIYPTEGDEKLLLGDECSGRITRVGPGVTKVQVGDRVCAIAAGCFGSHVITLADFTMAIPENMTYDEAATLPIVFLTASYALEHLAGISPGKKILIHAATGGVGLAAIQIARQAGAEIFATAGSPEKREFLHGLGVKHIMDSRSLSFYDEIMEVTNHSGVDIVLNSLSGDAIATSLKLLGEYGQFLEIGKRDIYQNTRIGLWAFRKNTSFHAIDLSRTMRDRIPLIRSMLSNLEERFHQGILTALPQLIFSQFQIAGAFRTMRQASHIGKVIINFNEKNVPLEITSNAVPLPVRRDGTYLITGGTSGFGLETARWLNSQGAGGLVLMSRSGNISEEGGGNPEKSSAREILESLEANGARVLVIPGDVCSYQDVRGALQRIQDSGLPPLRGIIHGAMVLDDAGVKEQNAERIHRAFAPKAQGAWVLHQVTKDLDLDFFNFYSSFNSVIGSPGQANYAAGNVFMEALAHSRKAAGKAALAINWGHIGEIGFVSRSKEVTNRLNTAGFLAMNPQTALHLEGELMRHGHSQTIVAHIDWSRLYNSSFMRTGASQKYARLMKEIDASEDDPSGTPGRVRERILAGDPGEQAAILQDFLHQLLARVLRTSPAKIEVNRPLIDQGLDSLMAVELINRMEGELKIGVPGTRLAYQSLHELTGTLLPLITGKEVTQ